VAAGGNRAGLRWRRASVAGRAAALWRGGRRSAMAASRGGRARARKSQMGEPEGPPMRISASIEDAG